MDPSNYYSIAGGIAGVASSSNIEECYNFNSVSAYDAGGIIGNTTAVFLNTCFNEGEIVGHEAGGIVGDLTDWSSSSFSTANQDCVNIGNASGTGYVGGVFGYVDTVPVITSCSNYGEISASGDLALGGIIGCLYNSSVSDCHNYGRVLGLYNEKYFNTGANVYPETIGGVVGEMMAQLTTDSTARQVTLSVLKCHNEGIIMLENYDVMNRTTTIGGIIGTTSNSIWRNDRETSIIINQCYNTVSINMANTRDDVIVGGILGEDNTRDGWVENPANVSTVIRNSYNTGDIHSSLSAKGVGGIVGHIWSYNFLIENCYNAGNIEGYYSVGGIVGGISYSSNKNQTIKISNCVVLSVKISGNYEGLAYYIGDGIEYFYMVDNRDSIIRENNLALNYISGNAVNDGATFISQAQAKSQNTYSVIGWNFDTVWEMPYSGGYPILQWQEDDEDDDTLYIRRVLSPVVASISNTPQPGGLAGKITASVSNNTISQPINIVASIRAATWTLHRLNEKNEYVEITDKRLPLNVGENTAFIELTALGFEKLVYLVTINRMTAKPDIGLTSKTLTYHSDIENKRTTAEVLWGASLFATNSEHMEYTENWKHLAAVSSVLSAAVYNLKCAFV
jgi:hypothetical protein